ncbi:MAG: nuclear transport factor 2 family protein [Pseudomonadota bacterium]
MTDIILAESHGYTLLQLEKLRGQALVERDFAALSVLLSDDLVHTHSTGVVQDKQAYLEEVAGPLCYLAIERRGLHVQCYDNLAVMSGYMASTLRPPVPRMPVTVEAHVLQVWQHERAGWAMIAFQATRLSAGAMPRQD